MTKVHVSENTLFSKIKKLYGFLTLNRQKQLKLLVAFSVFASFLELFSIGAIIPFIGALVQPEKVFNVPWIKCLLSYIGINSEQHILIPFTLAFVIAIVLSTTMRFMLQSCTMKLAFAIGIDLCCLAYRKVLYQPYLTHVKTNSSETINTITVKLSEVIFYIVLPCVILLSSSMVLMAMLGSILYFLPLSSFIILILFGGFYSIISKFSKKRLSSNSQKIAKSSTEVLKNLQEGLGGIRDIILDGSQEHYIKMFQGTMQRYRTMQAENQILNIVPRYVIEAIGMLFVAFLAYVFSTAEGGLIKELPKLVAIALAMQRMMPVVQQIYIALSTIQGYQGSLEDSLSLLSKSTSMEKNNNTSTQSGLTIQFNDKLSLENIDFSYGDSLPNVLSDFSATINKGDRIGIIGTTGSGKSTLIDLIMGLTTPAAGNMVVDGVTITDVNKRIWQNSIAHVPQVIYLSDADIAENIAFGVPVDEIDHDKVIRAAQLAQIHDMIIELPNGYKTLVGERGTQLSGGQRQRIGIARAFYKEAKLLVLDEATSALDSETETRVMNAINAIGKNVTVIMIAHRLTTLKACDKILELRHGKLFRECQYNELNIEPVH